MTIHLAQFLRFACSGYPHNPYGASPSDIPGSPCSYAAQAHPAQIYISKQSVTILTLTQHWPAQHCHINRPSATNFTAIQY